MSYSPADLESLSRLIGGKAAALTIAADAGLPVPPFYALTTAQAATLLKSGHGDESRRTILKDVRERVGAGSVAVRSSAQSEDGEHSFAGQFETRLGVDAEAGLLEAIAEVAAGVRSVRLEAYAAATGARSGAVAVVVQRMVEARAAGVAFSRDPLTFQPEVVVEAVQGAAELLVSGAASPTRVYFDRDHRQLTSLDDRTEVPSDVLQEAAGLALACEGLLGRAQDIEWAWDGQRVWLLQSRPLTGFTGAEVFSDTWSSEVWPGLIKPLVFDVGDIAVNAAWGRILTAITGPMEVDWRRMAALAASRAYFNETLLGRVLSRAGMPPNILETIVRGERTRLRDCSIPRLVVSTGRLLRFLARHIRWLAYLDKRLPPVRVRAGQARGATTRLAGAGSPGEATWGSHFAALLDLLEEASYLSALTTLSMGLRSLSLRLAARTFSPREARAAATMVRVETAPLRELIELREMVAGLTDEERATVTSGDPERIAQVLGRTASGRTVVESMARLVERWGHIGMVNTDFSTPAWRDQPGMLWGLASAPTPAVPFSAPAGPVARSPVGRAVLRRRSRALERFIAARDDVNDVLAQTYDAWRLSARAAGQALCPQVLEDPDLVYYLHLEELLGALAGEAEPGLGRLARERAKAHAADAHVSPPHRLWDLRLPPRHRMVGSERESARPGDELRGVGASAGVVTGRARVVGDFADTADIGHGDILVTGTADIGWTPFFTVVDGVVTAAGGMLSHAAVVARELGIPAVLAVEDADLLILDGVTIRIDGTEGTVTLLQAACPHPGCNPEMTEAR